MPPLSLQERLQQLEGMLKLPVIQQATRPEDKWDLDEVYAYLLR